MFGAMRAKALLLGQKRRKWLLPGVGPEKDQGQTSPGYIARAAFHMNRTQIKRSRRSLAPHDLFTKNEGKLKLRERGRRWSRKNRGPLARGAVKQEGKLCQQRPGLCPGSVSSPVTAGFVPVPQSPGPHHRAWPTGDTPGSEAQI